MSVTIVNVTFLIADSILALALLGYPGPRPPAARHLLGRHARQRRAVRVRTGSGGSCIPVGGFLVVVVLCCNLIGDALRDAVDVRLRRR